MNRRIVSLVLSLAAATAWADVRLPAVIGHNMVLQREMAVPIWGWAGKGEKVVVSFAGQEKTAVADGSGWWSVKLEALKADATPRDLTVAGTNTLVFTNVLVGEVWLCSGQSNMGMGLTKCTNGAAEVAAANDPGLRLFNVAPAALAWSAQDVKGQWDPCTPTNAATKGMDGGFSAVAYFFGREIRKEVKVPVGLITAFIGGTPIHMWTPRAPQEAVPELKAKIAPLGDNPGAYYNGMIVPLAPFGLRGVIWYQGEGDSCAGYRQALATLIGSWRGAWRQGDFPFYYVQLEGFRGAPSAPIREAQLQTLALPETGMASAVDLGCGGDVHPLNKQDVGHRLALVALAKTYGRAVPYSGPLYKTNVVEGSAIRITFDFAESGLLFGLKDGLKPVEEVAPGAMRWYYDDNGRGKFFARGRIDCLEIAGEDRKWTRAESVIDGSSLVVSNSLVSKPVAVRYAYIECPGTAPLGQDCLLYSKDKLPASPFRTDAW